jgi:enhancer of polycomb-like protein
MVFPQRIRKIHTRNTRFPVISAAEAENLEFIETDIDDAGRPHENTGVDYEDLQEHHLQVALDAAQKSALAGRSFKKAFIPTPDASRTISNYTELYPKRWKGPASLIRFSATVEESVGCSYCMDDDDEIWLRKFNNSRRSKDGPLSELSFEKIMSNFEDTTNERQPYLSTDPTVIAPFEDFEPTFEYLSLKALLPYAQHVYSHWKERRIKRMGRPLAPTLKFEENERDDSNDPYICFRRREVRQVRKTRRQDYVSSKRLRRLKEEMQQARDLVTMVSQREKTREQAIKAERKLFLMRTKVKDVKRKLGIVGADEDLVPVKKKKPVLEQMSTGMRPVMRPDGTPAGTLNMMSLAEYRRRRSIHRQAAIDKYCTRMAAGNVTWADLTEEEYTGLFSDAYQCFRNLTITETPSDIETDSDSVFSSNASVSSMSSTSSVRSTRSSSRIRQRYGRAGLVYFDRTMTLEEKENLRTDMLIDDPIIDERLKFDPRLAEDDKPVTLDEYALQYVPPILV